MVCKELTCLIATLFLGIYLPKIGISEPEARELFGIQTVGSSTTAYPYGSYSKGCLAGGVQLPETGPTWQAMRLSRNRNWGHPEMIDYIKNFSAKVAKVSGWKGIYVGDVAQPRGGPMLSGHRSHQNGLDADFWMLPATDIRLSRGTREKISSISLRHANGAHVNRKWTNDHHQMLKAAASDKRVARIFVFPGAKVRMCSDETEDRMWLRKIRPWWGHHFHFHVRLKCPIGASGCVDQSSPPVGDGCEEAKAWVERILNPKPTSPNIPKLRPPLELKMADLPKQCVRVLTSR